MEKKLKIEQKFVDYLVRLPEQGMGYQIVDVDLKNGRKLTDRIVLDSSLLILQDGETFSPEEIKTIDLSRTRHRLS